MSKRMAAAMGGHMATATWPSDAMAECYGTERYGTERESYQDPGEIPSVPDAARPVDNSISSGLEERLAEFIDLDRRGLSARQIAEQMSVTTRTVSRWRARLDRSKGTRAVRTPDDLREHARQIVVAGGSFEDAAQTIGVSRFTVRKWFPDLPGWTKAQAGAYGVMARRLNHVASAAGRKS